MRFNTEILILSIVSLLFKVVTAFVHPIGIHGRYFIDSVTREPFFIRGVDYQPGGSSSVSEIEDPLSDPTICARDIVLFQELGINTIRVYSINPDLNHDICMTMLASAGIYLVLDVNSPLPNQHLNRYEPWTTYNNNYLEHVFKVVEQFTAYNNTLGFFAGNEIVNDKKSANNSPAFIKKLVSDMKTYISIHCNRFVPVGYSAADDLDFRISLSKYLECSDGSVNDAIDFYGVNSYQWCGEQTFYTSGYDTLVRDYEEYIRPVFFSEYGCNQITPRLFEEVATIYSNDMIGVFSGGLVYEFTQEPNNYGLVDVDKNGNVKLLADFDHLKTQYATVEYPTGKKILDLHNRNGRSKKRLGSQSIPVCEPEYESLDVSKQVEESIGVRLIRTGVDVQLGKYVTLYEEELYSQYNITNSDGSPFSGSRKVKIINPIDEISEYESLRLNQLQSNCKFYKNKTRNQ
ncbi:hypothetical protein WICMUC_002566 [Wickerhamomyces mucosus]|uniref:1,3-beta-glucanosyltransferase n=1 Tax=Wickerhamomyces mucosus TaxID=1378264 RepID=A0A9P8TEA9_9ASCO|nr:hypothetical protein WICMUC_002566 [Wickerhamomyces mucosus]